MPATKRDKGTLTAEEILATQRERNRKKQAALRARRAQRLVDLEQEIARLGGNQPPAPPSASASSYDGIASLEPDFGRSVDGRKEIRKLTVVVGRLVEKLKELGVGEHELRSLLEDELEEIGVDGHYPVDGLDTEEGMRRRDQEAPNYVDFLRFSADAQSHSSTSAHPSSAWPPSPRTDPTNHPDPSVEPLASYPGPSSLPLDTSSSGKLSLGDPGNPSPNTPPGSAFPFAFLFSGPGPAGSILPHHELQQQQSFIRSLSDSGRTPGTGPLGAPTDSFEIEGDMPYPGSGEVDSTDNVST